jgi:protein transport protein SEC24
MSQYPYYGNQQPGGGAPYGQPPGSTQPPNAGMKPGFPAPPPSAAGFGAGGYAAPPTGQMPPPPSAAGFGGPPTGAMGAPPSNAYGGAPMQPNPGPPSVPKPSVQFFSVAGGNPTPSVPSNAGPPASSFGAMPPPPSGMNQQWGTQPGVPPLSQPTGQVALPGGAAQFYPAQGGVPHMSPTPGAATPGAYGVNMAPPPSGLPGAPPTMGGVPPPPSGVPGMPGMAAPPTGMGMPPPPTGMGGLPPPPVVEYPGSQYGAPPAHSMVGIPSAFGSMGNMEQPGMGMGMGGMGMSTTPGIGGAATPGHPGGDQQLGDQALGGAAPLPTLQEIDLTIQCDPAFMRATVSRLHVSQATANASRIPLGVVCRPMAGDEGITNEKIDVVDFGSTGIVRCKRCRAYINPFVSWVDNGRRWRCNICGMLNDVPTSYFSHLDNNGLRRDRAQRPELSKCSVEFVAPGDYMVRPPQPPVFFFVIGKYAYVVHLCLIASKSPVALYYLRC